MLASDFRTFACHECYIFFIDGYFHLHQSAKTQRRNNQGDGSAQFPRWSARGQNADRSRTDENAHLSTSHSSAEALRALKARLQGCKRRKDSVELIEYMVMASPEQFLEGGNLALDRGRAFFQETYQWLEKQHGAANVAWATIQY